MSNNSVMKKNIFVLLMLLTIALVAFGSTFLYVKINKSIDDIADYNVVTSCNPMYIATLNICDGIEGVNVTNLSQPTTGCLHDYQLTTADMKKLSQADVLIINGGGMEGYLDDVIHAYPNLAIIDSSEGIPAEYLIVEDELEHEDAHDEHEGEHEDEHVHSHSHGGVNSHTWMSTKCYKSQADYIAQALIARDADNAAAYAANYSKYCDTLDKSLAQYETAAYEKWNGSRAVILHEACEYVTDTIGVEVIGCMDLDEERQVSAGEVSSMVEEMREHDVTVIFAEEEYGADMAGILSKETGAQIVYINTLIRGTYNKDSYQTTMQLNYTSGSPL